MDVLAEIELWKNKGNLAFKELENGSYSIIFNIYHVISSMDDVHKFWTNPNDELNWFLFVDVDLLDYLFVHIDTYLLLKFCRKLLHKFISVIQILVGFK